VNLVSRAGRSEDEARTCGELRSKLTVGAILPGVVASIKNSAPSIDLGGIEGMLHASELGVSATSVRARCWRWTESRGSGG